MVLFLLRQSLATPFVPFVGVAIVKGRYYNETKVSVGTKDKEWSFFFFWLYLIDKSLDKNPTDHEDVYKRSFTKTNL